MIKMSKYYDSIAEGYDELYGEEQKKKMDIVKANIEIKPDTKILDIGCGSGISSDFDCICVGIDPSKKLIEKAIEYNKKRNEKIKKKRDHKYIVAKAEDIAELGFKDNEFDYILCISAIHHIKELEINLKEIKKIGKSFVFTVLKKMSQKRKIINRIKENFKVNKTIEEEKDLILFCE